MSAEFHRNIRSPSSNGVMAQAPTGIRKDNHMSIWQTFQQSLKKDMRLYDPRHMRQ